MRQTHQEVGLLVVKAGGAHENEVNATAERQEWQLRDPSGFKAALDYGEFNK